WRGLSLNQNQNTAHHTSPSEAKATKEIRQPIRPMQANTRGGVAAPPQRAKAHNMACALPRSRAGSHMLSMRVRMGKQPASPAPNRKRMTQRDTTFQAAPVSAVKTDQPRTICSK